MYNVHVLSLLPSLSLFPSFLSSYPLSPSLSSPLHSACTTFNLGIGQHQLQTIQPLQNYTIQVDASTAWYNGNYSAFTVQVHTQQYNITLRNASQDCNITRLCTAVGTSTGMVEILLSQGVFTYEASITNCSDGSGGGGGNLSNCTGVKDISILIAVVGIHAMGKKTSTCTCILVFTHIYVHVHT